MPVMGVFVGLDHRYHRWLMFGVWCDPAHHFADGSRHRAHHHCQGDDQDTGQTHLASI